MKLSLTQLARCLDLPPSTIERWASQGRIPVQISTSHCIFNPSALDKWAAAHNLKFTPPQALPVEPVIQPVETLLATMARGGVFKDIGGNSMESTLRAAVNELAAIPEASREDLFQKLLDRERLTSTGIGKGVAIPHPRAPLAEAAPDSLIATFFLKKPVDFNAIDDQPVFVLFLLISRSVQQHLFLLSRLSFCIRNEAFLSFLKTRPPQEALFSRIADMENEMDRTNR